MADPSSHATMSEDPRRERAATLAAAAAPASADPIARRDFLTRMGAAMALAGLGACTRAPREEIVPYVHQPPEVRPGIARFYATAFVLGGYATGLLVESHGGRPTKVEGNPLHPASLGATGVFEQASVLSLYDPSRARGARARGAVASWEEVSRSIVQGRWTASSGDGLWLLLEPTSSPTLAALLDDIRERLPRARIAFHSVAGPANAWEGARIAFGQVLETRPALERADVIVALDADLLTARPDSLRLSRQFARRRAVSGPQDSMNRLYVVEPLYTVTGANADHRLRVRASEIVAIAAALATAVGLPLLPGGIPPALSAAAAPHQRWIDVVARDLLAHRGRSLVIAGDGQPPEVHALAHAINATLGNLGVTAALAPSPIVDAGAPSFGIDALAAALEDGEVDTLVICAENPVYASPRGRELARLVSRARQSVYLGLHEDETAASCTFTIARAHTLESWGDARAFDGTVSIVQPLVEPLFGGRTELELLGLFAGEGGRASPYDLVRARLRARLSDEGGAGPGDDFERTWRQALRRGIVDGSARPAVEARVDWRSIAARLASASPAAAADLELALRPDPRVHDGRFANNAWLLELPSPVEKLTWTNAATLSTETASKLGIANGDELVIRAGERAVNAPVLVVPGQAEGTVGLSLGWGRSRGAELAHGRGANAFALADAPTFRPIPVHIEKTGAKRDLPITQTERSLVGRDAEVLQHGTLATLRDERRSTEDREQKPARKRQLSLYDREPGPSPWQWGMAIDLSRCTGCNACVVACQAENNVPTVGPDNVVLNREMHWLRIDAYVVGDAREPHVAFQPMLCQHCEKAPCEYVCPVNATVHSPDGLNEMVYNRCVGTRFCSNNCPYKVRRFNWFDFHRAETPTEQLVHNPDVTVRERGVMEKCTFCVQRLRHFEIETRQGKGPAAPRTACQQVCPTEAIVFGDILQRGAEVKRLSESERAFVVLDELGTEPRVRYLSRLTNPNPELST
jgi:molybdopterin-containing oxidoreductase family iron-sulfur binding subunit